MKVFITLVIAVACVVADVSHLQYKDGEVPIIRSTFDINPEGSYQYAYESGNGISQQAEGIIKNGNTNNPTLEVKGGVRYTSPEGVPVELSYIANEDGYQPQGSHLPVGPPAPEWLARSLAYIASHPQQPESVVVAAKNNYAYVKGKY